MEKINILELEQIIKLSKLNFTENELKIINQDIHNIINMLKQINDLVITEEFSNDFNYSNLRDDNILSITPNEELFKNINHKSHNYGIIIPKTFN